MANKITEREIYNSIINGTADQSVLVEFANKKLAQLANGAIYADTGEVVEFNTALEDASAINADPYGNGWIIKIKPANMADIDALLDNIAYTAKIGA